jgi:2-keto-4-pentenoate hydratase/2-oxohepta-3-ene-1,7-dioic acid hydratase in catechol pathway
LPHVDRTRPAREKGCKTIMKFVSYEYTQGPSFGAVIGNDIVDLSDAGPSLRAVLASGPLGNLQAVAAKRKPTVALDHVVLLQVIPDAGRVLCVGRNYRDHVAEMGNAPPANPNIFMRTTQSLVGHRQSIVCPSASSHYDFEGELGVVIGRGGRRITPDRALSHVAGYTCFFDGSVRDRAPAGRGWCRRRRCPIPRTSSSPPVSTAKWCSRPAPPR